MLAASQREELKAILKTTVVQLAFKEVEDEAQAKREGFISADLSTPQGVAAAQQLQGECRGMARAVELIQDLTKEEDDGTGTE